MLYRKKLYFITEGGLGGPPIFNHYSWRRPALRYGRTRKIRQAAEMQKRRSKIPDLEHVINSTTNLLNEGKLAYSQPLVRRKSLDFAYALMQ